MNLKAEIEQVLLFYRVSVGNAILGNILEPDTDEATTRLLKLFRDGVMEIMGDDEPNTPNRGAVLEGFENGRNQLRSELRTKITEATK